MGLAVEVGGGSGGCGGGVEEEVAHKQTKVINIHRCLLSYIIKYYKRIDLYSYQIDEE